jgi:AcrR family transcriptional regulator
MFFPCSEKETMTVGIKQRRERERQATYRAILQAALEIASENTWEAVTIRRVAERIEYSPSAIYKYFEDKEGILFALLRQGFQQQLAALERISAQERNPSARLLQIAAAYWDFAWHHPTLYQLMFDLKGKVREVVEAKAAFLVVRRAIEESATPALKGAGLVKTSAEADQPPFCLQEGAVRKESIGTGE